MTRAAAAFVNQFVKLPATEQAAVIDVISEYYLANPRRREHLLQNLASLVETAKRLPEPADAQATDIIPAT